MRMRVQKQLATLLEVVIEAVDLNATMVVRRLFSHRATPASLSVLREDTSSTRCIHWLGSNDLKMSRGGRVFLFNEENDSESVDRIEFFNGCSSDGKKGLEIANMIKTSRAAAYESGMVTVEGGQDRFTNRAITHEAFNILLEMYNHNQLVIMNGEETRFSTKQIRDLSDLESWFILVVEPPPIAPNKRRPSREERLQYEEEYAEWLRRETSKSQGFTVYCDKRVQKRIHITSEVLEQVHRNTRIVRSANKSIFPMSFHF